MFGTAEKLVITTTSQFDVKTLDVNLIFFDQLVQALENVKNMIDTYSPLIYTQEVQHSNSYRPRPYSRPEFRPTYRRQLPMNRDAFRAPFRQAPYRPPRFFDQATVAPSYGVPPHGQHQ